MSKVHKVFRGAAQRSGIPKQRSIARRMNQQAWKPVTSGVPGLNKVAPKWDPGSPCYNFRKVDYTSHVLLPSLMGERLSKRRVQFARVSPRWGATAKHHRENRVISPPWAAGQIKLEGTKSHKKILKGKKNLGHVELQGKRVDLRLSKKYRNRGYNVEVAHVLQKQRPDLKPQLHAVVNQEKLWNQTVPFPGQKSRRRKGK